MDEEFGEEPHDMVHPLLAKMRSPLPTGPAVECVAALRLEAGVDTQVSAEEASGRLRVWQLGVGMRHRRQCSGRHPEVCAEVTDHRAEAGELPCCRVADDLAHPTLDHRTGLLDEPLGPPPVNNRGTEQLEGVEVSRRQKSLPLQLRRQSLPHGLGVR